MAAPSLAVLAGLLSAQGGAAQDQQMESEAANEESANSPAETLTEIKYNSEHGQAPYQVTFISVSYRRSEGLVLMPGSSDESDICQESKPWGTKLVEWSCARIRRPPNLPSRESSDNETLAYEEVLAMAIGVMPDGATPLYYRQGSQLYYFGNPPDMEANLTSPKNPALKVTTPSIRPTERESLVSPLDS